jgi:hypothetical protein
MDGELGVGADDELGGGLGLPERGEPDRDFAVVGVNSECRLDSREARAGLTEGGAAHHAEKLVAADASDQIVDVVGLKAVNDSHGHG